jgi:hypothetical protein
MMSSPHLRLVSPEPAAPPHQTSFANLVRRVPVQGRGRSLEARRRIAVAPQIGRLAAMDWWADLLARRCGSRELSAVTFGVTFQCACNWWDRVSCPTGDKVMQAMAMWPEEFGLAEAA